VNITSRPHPSGQEKEALKDMRALLIAGALGIFVLALSACGGSSGTSEEAESVQRQADLYDISQIERSFHEAISKKDIDELVSLFAPNATGTFGPGKTVAGREQIRQVWLNSVGWKPETHWLSDHPAYKLKVTVDGDRGTLHFECHFIDVDTGEVAALTAGNLDVARIDGRWLITNFVGSTAELKI
jgi:ketosteroid isomerase-like protein